MWGELIEILEDLSRLQLYAQNLLLALWEQLLLVVSLENRVRDVTGNFFGFR